MPIVAGSHGGLRYEKELGQAMIDLAREIHRLFVLIAAVAWLILLPSTGLLYLLGALR